MLKVKDFLELFSTKALINRIHSLTLWRELYTCFDRDPHESETNHENHIWVEETITLPS
jgi:hypothetical protein